jgi:hypothetical protein
LSVGFRSPSQISPETATRKRKQFATKKDSSATSKESVFANHSIDDELCPSVDITVDTGGRLVQDEKVEVGSIPMETYNTYIKAAGGYLLATFVFSMFVINVVGTGINYSKPRNLKILNQLNPILIFFLKL